MRWCAVLLLTLCLPGCAPDVSSSATATSEPPTAKPSLTATDTALPAAPTLTQTATITLTPPPSATREPTNTPTLDTRPVLTDIPPGAFPVTSGEILYTRDGSLYALRPGAVERLLGSVNEALILEAISPDGRYAVIGNRNVDVLDLQTGTSKQIGRSNERQYLRWAPDGSALYFVTHNQRIWRLSTDWGEQQVVYEAPEGFMLPEPFIIPSTEEAYLILSDGRLLIQLTDDDRGDTYSIVLHDPATGVSQTLIDGYILQDLSSDESRLLLADGTNLAYLAALDAELSILAAPQHVITPVDSRLGCGAAPYQFAPDGRRLILMQGCAGVVAEPISDTDYRFIELKLSFYDYWTRIYDSNHTITLQQNYDTNEFELWLLPLDGSAGQLLMVVEPDDTDIDPHVVP